MLVLTFCGGARGWSLSESRVEGRCGLRDGIHQARGDRTCSLRHWALRRLFVTVCLLYFVMLSYSQSHSLFSLYDTNTPSDIHVGCPCYVFQSSSFYSYYINLVLHIVTPWQWLLFFVKLMPCDCVHCIYKCGEVFLVVEGLVITFCGFMLSKRTPLGRSR